MEVYYPHSPKQLTINVSELLDFDVPESPTFQETSGPIESYNPVSPRYCPQSPKRSFSNPRFENILNRLKNRKNFTMYRSPYQPIANPVSYIHSKRRADSRRVAGLKNEKELLEEYELQYQGVLMSANTVQSVVTQPVEPKRDYDYLNFSLKVNPDDSGVRVQLVAPMWVLHDAYYSKGQKAPLKTYVQCMKKFGYSDSLLEKAVKHEMDFKENAQEYQDFLNAVFGKSKR